jgi:hypothetical protein
MNTRRTLLLWAGAWPLASAAREAPTLVLILRHALTDPGVGDPPGYQLGRCETQRNLSREGRDQARAFGRRLAGLGLQPTAWRSSRWCRCLDTAAEIAAGVGVPAPAVQAWPALDSFFDAREREPHQSALVGVSSSMGQTPWLAPSRGDSPLSAQPFA